MNQRGEKQEKTDGRQIHKSVLAPDLRILQEESVSFSTLDRRPQQLLERALSLGRSIAGTSRNEVYVVSVVSWLYFQNPARKKQPNIARAPFLLDLDALPPVRSFEEIGVVHLRQRKGQELGKVGTDFAYCQAVQWRSTFQRLLGKIFVIST